ncbi:helix-turn-helix transcriptional regulator [Jeotgalicoccus sp. S0W5]|uniref:helix-turn-helix domain-containing protein n=1 Tax=Jeotgalicoccus sp. S0W5 TaxID=2527874 RepID=UPI00141501FC|nr:helix-turn-helix transcriptional regulator [Jeotgalicoccus sp. S0W5]
MLIQGKPDLLKMLLLTKGYSLKHLSHVSGVSYSTVRNVIVYDRKTTTQTAFKIATALEKDVTELFNYKEV